MCEEDHADCGATAKMFIDRIIGSLLKKGFDWQVVEARLESGVHREVKDTLQENLDETVRENEILYERMSSLDKQHQERLLHTQRDHEDKVSGHCIALGMTFITPCP